MAESTLHTVAQRRRAVAWVLALTHDTALAPGRYERQLLARYEQGELTIDQVLDLLDQATYQILYRRRATALPTESDLQRLLDQARVDNAEADITGLLLYSNGRYIQVLEGPEDEVRATYARILRDPRHTQVITVREGLGPARRFPDWGMARGNVALPAVTRLLEAVLAEEPFHGVPIDQPLLHRLLDAFGVSRETELQHVAYPPARCPLVQLHKEACPGAFFAFHPHLAAVQLHYLPGDEQAQPRARLAPHAGPRRLGKLLK
jgi:hypothetical protein